MAIRWTLKNIFYFKFVYTFAQKYNRQMKKNMEENLNSFSLINANTKFVGEINSDSDLRIDGTVEGNINSKAKVILGNGATVKGNINCQNADISCQVVGTIIVEDTIKLSSTANIKGDIFTKKLIVENGAIFNGKCEMGGDFSKITREKLAPQQTSLFSKTSEKSSEA